VPEVEHCTKRAGQSLGIGRSPGQPEQTHLDGSEEQRYLSSMSVATIQAEVLGLPPGERAKLIDVLWDSLASPELRSREAAWAEES